MRESDVRHVWLATMVMLVTPMVASAETILPSGFQFKTEEGGGTFAATVDGVEVRVGLLGFNRVRTDEAFTLTADDIRTLAGSDSTRIVGLYNGQAGSNRTYASGPGYESRGRTLEETLQEDGTTSFTAVTFDGLSQRFYGAVFVAFTGSNPFVWRGSGASGTSTFGGGGAGGGSLGNLGELNEVRSIPLPAPAVFAAIGLATLGVPRRR